MHKHLMKVVGPALLMLMACQQEKKAAEAGEDGATDGVETGTDTDAKISGDSETDSDNGTGYYRITYTNTNDIIQTALTTFTYTTCENERLSRIDEAYPYIYFNIY
jgi:hypothetical protein